MAATSATAAVTPAPSQATPTGTLGQQALAYVDEGIVNSGEDDTPEAPSTPATPTPQQPQETSDQPPAEDLAGESGNEIDDIESFFAEKQAARDDAGDEDADDVDDGQQPEGSGRADRRIRRLSNDLRQAAAENQAMRQAMQQQHQWSQQVTRQFQQQQEMLRQTQLQLAELRGLAQGRNPQEPESDVDRFRREVTEQAQRAAAEKLNPELTKAMREIEALKRERAQEVSFRKSMERKNQYNTAVHSALEKHIAPRMDPQVYQAIRPRLGGMALSIAYGQGNTDMDAAVMTLSRVINDAALGIIRHGRSTKGKKVAASQEAPERPVAQTAAHGEPIPPLAVLQKHGFKSAMDWQFKGEPRLT